MMTIDRYAIGIGDRFGHQGVAQLRAFAIVVSPGNVISNAPCAQPVEHVHAFAKGGPYSTITSWKE